MPPKGKKGAAAAAGAAAAPPQAPEFVIENEIGLLCEYDELMVSTIDFEVGSDDLFSDSDYGNLLPGPLQEVVSNWQRPDDFLAELLADGATPCVVQLPAPEPTKAPPPVKGGAAPAPTPPLPPPPRVLPNPIRPGASGCPDDTPAKINAIRALEWITSCMQLVALHVEKLPLGTFLWELVYPKGPGDLPIYNTSGKYGVRIFEHGSWRFVLVDDRIPFDADGAPLVPVSNASLELWPLLLAKALYKVSVRSGGGLIDEEAVLHHLTGWTPQRVPISDSMPRHAIYDFLQQRIGQGDAVIGLALRADPSAEEARALAGVGMRAGPLLGVHDLREHGGTRFARLHSEILQWEGAYRDTDEEKWSIELADALEWKRLQRLRIRAAGLRLSDFWVCEDSLRVFAHVLLLHVTQPHTATYTVAAPSAGVPPPTLLVLGKPSDGEAEAGASAAAGDGGGGGGGDDGGDGGDGTTATTLLGLQCSAAKPMLLSVAPFGWAEEADLPMLLQLPCGGFNSIEVKLKTDVAYLLSWRELKQRLGAADGAENQVGVADRSILGTAEARECGTERTGAASAADSGTDGQAARSAEEVAEAEEAAAAAAAVRGKPYPVAIRVGADVPVRLGDAEKLCTEVLGLHVQTLSGKVEPLEVGVWSLVLKVNVKAKGEGAFCAKLSLDDAEVAAAVRLHTVDDVTHTERTCVGLSTGEVPIGSSAPSISLLVDVKPRAALSAATWKLQVSSNVELEIGEANLNPSRHLSGKYAPNADFRLLRAVLTAQQLCSGSVHLDCDHAEARLVLRALKIEGSAKVTEEKPEPAVPAKKGSKKEESKKSSGDHDAHKLTKDSILGELKSAVGLGSATIVGLPVQDLVVIECLVDAASAHQMKLPMRPDTSKAASEGVPDAESHPALPAWELRVVSSGNVNLARDTTDEQALSSLQSSWESSQPGRAAKAKELRESYLASLGAGANDAADAGDSAGEAAAEAAEAAEMAKAEAGAEARVLIKHAGEGETRLLSAEEKAAQQAARAQAVKQHAEAQEASDAKRNKAKHTLEASVLQQVQEARNARATAAATQQSKRAQCNELLARFLPPPEVETVIKPEKGKKGK